MRGDPVTLLIGEHRKVVEISKYQMRNNLSKT